MKKEENIKNYIEYAKQLNASKEVLFWISHNLNNYLKNHKPKQSTVEHIIDFLVSDKSPKRLRKMSFTQANKLTIKWNKTLKKKGSNIKETKDDIKIIHNFKDGFKIVQLIGEKAYKREGFLMRHCVLSYYNKDDIIYSLRDKNNKPHCTMSKSSQQIKGKGNGCIHPKYINYIIKFLEKMDIKIRDSEMENLGYKNMLWAKKGIKNKLYKSKYLYKQEKLILKKGYIYFNQGEYDVNKTYNKKILYNGSLNLRNTKIKSLPDNLFVGGSLDLENTKIKIGLHE